MEVSVNDFVWDIKSLAACMSAVAAWVALCFALRSFQLAKKSLEIAQAQERRRQPQLVPSLAEGYSRRTRDQRLYAVSLSVSNRTDSDNAIARIELQVKYRTTDGIIMTIRLPHNGALLKDFGRRDMQIFTPPFSVTAHNTLAGWGLFALPTSVIGQAEIEDYLVLLLDTHGISAVIEPGIFREIETHEKNADSSVPNAT